MTHDNGVAIVKNRHLKSIFIKPLNLFCRNSNTKNELFNQSTIKYPISNYVFSIRNHKYIYIYYKKLIENVCNMDENWKDNENYK